MFNNNDRYGLFGANMATISKVSKLSMTEEEILVHLGSGCIRLSIILGNKKSNPQVPPLIPVSKSTWWEGVKSGRYPKPIKFCPRITAWRVEDIRQLMEAGF